MTDREDDEDELSARSLESLSEAAKVASGTFGELIKALQRLHTTVDVMRLDEIERRRSGKPAGEQEIAEAAIARAAKDSK